MAAVAKKLSAPKLNSLKVDPVRNVFVLNKIHRHFVKDHLKFLLKYSSFNDASRWELNEEQIFN